LKTKFNPIAAIVLFVLAICLYLFHSLTIEIDDNNLRFYFAHGFWKKNISLEEIDRIEIVKNHWYYGWGIKLMPHGWLYNVSGLKAIEIQKKNGRMIRIGSDEPEKVKEILDKIKSS